MSFVLDVSGDLATQSVGQQTGLLFAGVGAVLVLATLVAETLRWRQRGQPSAVIANLVSRIRAWWVMAIVVGLALFFGRAGVIVLFAIISLFALREFITLAPTRSGDYYALLAAFYIVLPWQYYLVWIDWYGMYTLLIPVYAFLFLPILSTIGGDTTHYLERTAKVQWGLMICVFCISHVPLLLNLHVPGHDPSRNVLLFAFLWTNSGGRIPLLSDDGYRVSASFERTGGLSSGADVRLAGVPVGKVTDIDPDFQRGHVVVTFEVDRGVEIGPETTAEWL